MILQNSTGTGKNATSKVLLVGSYHASRNIIVRPSVRLSNLNAAAASLTLYVELIAVGGSASLGEISMTKPKPTAASTTDFNDFPQGGVSMRSGELLNIYLLSTNASDTSVNYDIDYCDYMASNVVYWKGVAPADLSSTYVQARNEDGAKIGTGTGTALTSQGVADALKLAPSAGAPASGSVYAKLNGITTIGTGADLVTLTFTDGATPISGAEVWVSSDSGGATIVAGTLTTNDDGEVVMLLDAGTTYYAWLKKSGVNPILGSAFVASAD